MRMFGIIFRRELHRGLTTFAFPSILVALTALIPPSAYIQARSYQQALSDYALRQAAHQGETRSGLLIITRPVPPLLPLSNGLFGRLPDEVLLLRESASWTPTSEDLRPLDWLFPKVDLSVIVGVLMTLMALLMTYNTVTGEREQGTLKQLLSYSLPRHTILGGKLAASVLLLTLSLFYAVFLYTTLIVAFSHGMFRLSRIEVAEVLAIAVIGMLTVSVFALLGLAISTLVRTSAAALALSLTIWASTVLLWPSCVGYLAASLWPVEPRQLARRELLAQEARLIRNELADYRKRAAELKVQAASVTQAWEQHLEIKRRWNERKREEIRRVMAERERQIHRQQTRGIGLVLLSPYGAFRMASDTICQTGVQAYDLFLEEVARYEREEFTPKSFQALAHQQPGDGREKPAPSVSFRPFSLSPPSLRTRLTTVAAPVSVLILEMASLWLISLFRFHRYDVR